jgi:flagellar biosynthesis protein FliR
MDSIVDHALATVLLSLRFAPTFAFAPPFTLIRVPALFRLWLALAIAATLVATYPANSWAGDFRSIGIIAVAATELFLGLAMALALQLAFGMLAMTGRALDIQAGFGLSMLIDPTTRNQAPLIGTLLAYGMGATFFLSGGGGDVLALFALSVASIPLGHAGLPDQIAPLLTYLSAVTLAALGLIGVLLLVLLLIDLSIAAMSRTLPQMNVMLLGFQVKAFATLALLPLLLGIASTGFMRLLRLAFDATPTLIA